MHKSPTNQKIGKNTIYLISYTGTEVVDGLWGKPSSPEGSEGEEAWVVPISTNTIK